MKAISEANDNLILLISNEAHFHLNGMVNQQNYRENPKDHCIVKSDGLV